MLQTNDKYYIEKALDDIQAIIGYTVNHTYNEFMSDVKTIDATMFRLQQMVENIKKISLEYKQENYNIDWKSIVGFRNRIVHEYNKIDYSTIYETISTDIYELKKVFESTLANK